MRLVVPVIFAMGCIGQIEGADTPPPSPTADHTPQAPAVTTKKQLAYIAIPHPDDEFEGWSLVQHSPDNYPVFVLMTHGEETGACLSAAETTGAGPYWYQGAGSPVGQPDLGERVTGNPWQGKWNPACDAARLASWHEFLDGMATQDDSLPYQPPFVGHFCFAGNTTDGVPPTRVDNGVAHVSNCADVWANTVGARVVFDLGDGDVAPAEVIWALQAVRANRGAWGIPALPEHEIVGAAWYNATAENSGVPAYSGCAYYGHPDHHAIHVALWNTNLGAGPQYGRTCDSDPDVAGTGGRTNFVDAAIDAHAFAVDAATGARIGAHVVAYGWLNPTYYDRCDRGCGFSDRQDFWKR